MTKRRLLIVVLALVAVAVAVPAVPWVIVEWHVREISTDRQALLDALEAPEGSWEWRAVEKYAGTPAGEEALRLELTASWMLLHPGQKPAVFSEDPVSELVRGMRTLDGSWMVAGLAGTRYLTVLGGWEHAKPPGSPPTAGSSSGSSHFQASEGTMHFSYDAGEVTFSQRLSSVVSPSKEPVTSISGLTFYVLRLSDPINPPEARVEGFDDPDTLVVFAKLRDADGDATVHASN